MALDIIKLYITLLSEFFLFSDMAVMSPGRNTTPPLFPKCSNSLTTAHHLMKLLGEIQDSVNDVAGMDISGEATSSLKSLLESAKWKFADILVNDWLRGQSLIPFLSGVCDSQAPRCEHLLLPRDMDRLDRRPIYDDLPLPDARLPEADHDMCLQGRRRRRPVLLRVVLVPPDEAEPDSNGIRREDHKGLFGLAVRVPRWDGALGVGREPDCEWDQGAAATAVDRGPGDESARAGQSRGSGECCIKVCCVLPCL